MLLSHLFRRAAALAAVALLACGDEDDPITPPGTLAVAASRSTLTITQGNSDTLTVTVTRGGSFTGPVELSASGAPTGATVSFGSATLAAGQTSTMATITVVAAVAPGTYPITVTARGAGLTDQTTTINLAVVAAQVADFTLAATPDTIRVTQGDSAAGRVRLTKTGGFQGSVALTTDSLPAGVTVSFAQATLGDSTVLTVRAISTAATGTSRLIVRGTSGTTVRADTVSLVVSAAPNLSVTVSPDSLSLVAGTNGQARVRLTRTGGLTDTVRLRLTGAPTGVTGTFGDSALVGDSTVLTVATAATTVPGTYNVGVQATAGTRVRVDTLRLIVAAPPGNSLNIVLTPALDSIAIRSSDTVRVNIQRTGFAGPVSLRTDSLPTGVRVQIDTVPVAGDTARVPITIDSTATMGSFTIRFIGSAAGVSPDTATYTLVIKAVGTGPGGSSRIGLIVPGPAVEPLRASGQSMLVERRLGVTPFGRRRLATG